MARLTQHWHRFTVDGRGQFPVDMLRYDQCHPIGPDDAANIQDGCRDHSRRVTLGRWAASTWVPTADRWASFCWVSANHEVMD